MTIETEQRAGRPEQPGRRTAGARQAAGGARAGAARRPEPTAPVGAAGARRAELALFLRSRRERMDPESLGVPVGARRRTPGLRREELAQLAGVGVTWYTWLEQGRPINASTQVLDAVARVLGLDQSEQGHLYELAGVVAPAPAGRLQLAVEPELQAVLDGMPHMAVIINERYDVLAWNRPFERWFPSLTDDDLEYRNMLWATFSVPSWACPMANRREEMRWSVATLRGAYARHIGEPCWEQFIKDMLEVSADFAEMWQEREVAAPADRLRTFRHPMVGPVTLKLTSFGVHALPGARMVVYLPYGPDSEEAVRILDEADRKRDASVAAVYQDWLSCGMDATTATPQ